MQNDVLCTLGEEAGDVPGISLKVWTGRGSGEGLSLAAMGTVMGPRALTPEAVAAAAMHVSALEWPAIHVALGTASGALHVAKFDRGVGWGCEGPDRTGGPWGTVNLLGHRGRGALHHSVHAPGPDWRAAAVPPPAVGRQDPPKPTGSAQAGPRCTRCRAARFGPAAARRR